MKVVYKIFTFKIFPTENLCRPNTFYKIFFLQTRKFSMNRLYHCKIFNFKIFFRLKICVAQTHFTKFSFCRQENFPWTDYIIVKFSTSKFFPTENLCRPNTFYKIFFLQTRKFSMDRLYHCKIFNFKIFFRLKICVAQTHFTKFSFCRQENFPWTDYIIVKFSTSKFFSD